jgi:hypothetical protein
MTLSVTFVAARAMVPMGSWAVPLVLSVRWRFAGEELLAEAEAVATDANARVARLLGVPTDRRPAGRVHHRLSLTALAAAEAAARLRLGEAKGHEHREVIRSALACRVYLVGEIEAAIADEHAGSRDQLAHLGPSSAAERTGETGVRARLVAAALPCHATRLHGTLSCRDVDDLMHSLEAQPKRLGDLSHRAAGGVQPPDRVLIGDLSLLRLVLQSEQPIPRLLCFAESLVV